MKAVTAQTMRAIDRIAIEQCGVPGVILMEHAGKAVAERVKTILREQKERRVVICCGTGNNGGDGYVAARHLANWGADVALVTVSGPARLKGAQQRTMARYVRMGCVQSGSAVPLMSVRRPGFWQRQR